MKKINQLWTFTLVFKLILAAWLPFFFDENYYWVWSHNLQLSYYDHPPFVSFLYFLGQWFDWFGQASRWPGVILGHFTIYVWILILKEYLTLERLFKFSLLMCFWPIFGLTAVVVTPDVPLLFFWSLSFYYFQIAFKSKQLKYYLLFGLALGLGGLSKYQIFLFLPPLIAYLCFYKNYQKIVWRYVPFTILMAALACSPVFIWNYLNNWDSFLFQIDHGLGSKTWKPIWTFDYLWSQALIIFPLILFYAFKRPSKDTIIFHLFAWFPLIFFLFSSFKGRVEANWPLPAYPAIAALCVIQCKNFKWLKYAISFWILVMGLILSEAAFRWLPSENINLKTEEFYQYDDLIKIAESYTPFYANSFQMASYLSFRLKKPIYKLRDYRRRDFFDYLEASIPKEKLYYFAAPKNNNSLPEWAKNHKIKLVIPLNKDINILEIEQP